ncbi:MAG: hypothetical protein H7843_01460 [Nitrospirota bacterium]
MSYTIANFLGMEPRGLVDLIPAEKLDTLESIMKHWAGKLYESFDSNIDKDKIAEHVKWIYGVKKYQRPKVIVTYNPEHYKSLAAEALIKDTPADINMKDYVSRIVNIPAWLSSTIDSSSQIEHMQASLKNIIARVPFRNTKEFSQFISANRMGVKAETRGSSTDRSWLYDAQLNHLFNGFGLWADSGWFVMFDVISALGIRKNDLIDRYRGFLQTGVFASMFFKNNAVILIQPKHIKMTANGQIHSDGTAAIDWRDGHKTYVLHNVLVPEYIALTPHHELDPMLVLTEKNAEIRREIVRKIGVERLVTHFGGVVIDKYQDYELIELTLKEIDITARYLKMKNPSIGTWHVEGVPTNIKTCLEALEWRISGVSWNPEQPRSSIEEFSYCL